MSAEANKALVRRFYEQVWGAGNYDVADEVFAPDYVRHDFRSGDPTPGPEGQALGLMQQLEAPVYAGGAQ